MDKKDQQVAVRERARSLDQMKSRIQALVENILVKMQQPELAKIAFSVQHWHDDSCSEEEFNIPGPPAASNSKSLSIDADDKGERALAKLEEQGSSQIGADRKRRPDRHHNGRS